MNLAFSYSAVFLRSAHTDMRRYFSFILAVAQHSILINISQFINPPSLMNERLSHFQYFVIKNNAAKNMLWPVSLLHMCKSFARI